MRVLRKNSLTPTGARIRATSLKIDLSERSSSITATVTGSEVLEVGTWIQTDEGPVSGMVWRIRSVDDSHNGGGTWSFTAETILQALKDLVMFGETTTAKLADKKNASTVAANTAVKYILGKDSRFTLGTCDFKDANPYAFNGENLLAALETISASLTDPCWSLDCSAYPFKLSIKKPDSSVGSEMRMSRNITGPVKISVDRSQMYTRFYAIGKDNLKLTETYLQKNTDKYGVIEHVETDQSMDTQAKLKAWATERLNNHCEPVTTITVPGLYLSESTGEALDRITINRKCRIPLPDGTVITEKVTKLTWADWVKEPAVVTVVLCNQQADTASIIKQIARSTSSGHRAAAKAAGEDHAWIEDTAEHVALVAETIIGRDKNGIEWKRVSELKVGPNGIFGQVDAIAGDVSKYGTRFEQNESAIGMVVGTYKDGKNYIKAGEICLSINDSGDAEAKIKAKKILLLGETIAQKISADYIESKIELINQVSVKSLYVQPSGKLSFYTGDGKVNITGPTAADIIRNLKIERSGDTYTLSKITFGEAGWQTVGTFSRATTLSGAWSGGKFTVTASPQAEHLSVGFVSGSDYQLELVTNGTPTLSPGNNKYVDAPLKIQQLNGQGQPTSVYTETQMIDATAAWNNGQTQGKKDATVTLSYGTVTTDSQYQKHVTFTATNDSNTSKKDDMVLYLVRATGKAQLRKDKANGTIIMEINTT